MKRNYVLPLIAIFGVIVAIAVIIENNQPISKRPLVIQPSQSPYSSSIAGTGIIEATSGNIAIGTPVSGVIKAIDVKVGDYVNQGDVLFKIDDRDLQAQLLTAVAKADEAEAALQKPRHRLKFRQQLNQHEPGSVSPQVLSDLRDDVAQFEATYKLTKAQVEQVKIEISRRIIRAPVSGQILQLRARVGEYAEGRNTSVPLLLLGSNKKLYMRVNINDTDSWRYQPGAKAIAFVRGNSKLKIPLQYEYIEPYVIPKVSLSGKSTERTDVRVLQVIYSFQAAELPVYVGQQLDVFIQSKPDAPENIEKDQ